MKEQKLIRSSSHNASIEIGVGMLLIGETVPVALTGAAIVEGSMLLGTGIAYVHEQLSPQEGTCDVRDQFRCSRIGNGKRKGLCRNG